MLNITFYIFPICNIIFYFFIHFMKHRINSHFAKASSTKINWGICIAKAKVFLISRKPTLFLSKRNYILTIEKHCIFFIPFILLLIIESSNASLVCMSRNISFRNTNSYPNSTFFALTFTNKLHNPYFIFISNRKRLTMAIITVLCYQIRHYFYSLASCF